MGDLLADQMHVVVLPAELLNWLRLASVLPQEAVPPWRSFSEQNMRIGYQQQDGHHVLEVALLEAVAGNAEVRVVETRLAGHARYCRSRTDTRPTRSMPPLCENDFVSVLWREDYRVQT